MAIRSPSAGAVNCRSPLCTAGRSGTLSDAPPEHPDSDRASTAAQSAAQTVKNRRRRRTCADDGDTDREILRQIVCEELCSECAVCRKILSKGFPKGEIDALGAAVRACCP